MSRLVEPRILRGFRDYPPDLMIPRERFMETARQVYRSYGFAPIDTPAIELTEVLAEVDGGRVDPEPAEVADLVPARRAHPYVPGRDRQLRGARRQDAGAADERHIVDV